jgi:hypothetical protein
VVWGFALIPIPQKSILNLLTSQQMQIKEIFCRVARMNDWQIVYLKKVERLVGIGNKMLVALSRLMEKMA